MISTNNISLYDLWPDPRNAVYGVVSVDVRKWVWDANLSRSWGLIKSIRDETIDILVLTPKNYDDNVQ